MQNLKSFLSAHWVKIALLVLPLLGGLFGWSIKTTTAAPGESPSILITLPGEDPEPLVFAAAGPGQDEGPLLNVARRLAGNSYARQHGLNRAQGHELAFAVPFDEIRTHAAIAGVVLDTIPKTYSMDPATGVYRGPLLDWIKAHPEQFAQIVKTVLTLISLFANNQPFPPAEYYVLVAPCNSNHPQEASMTVFQKPTPGELQRRYQHHPPHGDQAHRYGQVRLEVLGLAVRIVDLTPCSPEQARALNALDEVMFLANAAIARHEKPAV